MKKLHYLFFGLTLCFTLFTSCADEPLEGDFATSDDGITSGNCQDAAMIFQDSTAELQNATDANYELVCTNYKQTIEGLLDTCQAELDQDFIALLQAALVSAGDCTVANGACVLAQETSETVATAYANATAENQEALCNSYTTTLQAEIAACGDTNGSIQQTINNLPCGDCGQAQANTQAALDAFEQADIADVPAYEALCGNYSMMLQAQIDACGDPDGALTALALELGDCTPPEEDGPVRLLIEGEMKNFNTAAVTINGSLLSVVATDLDTGDTFTFDIVLQQTGTNVMQNVQLTVNSVVHMPFMSGDTPFTSVITENSGTVIIGTFTGTVIDPGGEFVLTSDGIIDIAF